MSWGIAHDEPPSRPRCTRVIASDAGPAHCLVHDQATGCGIAFGRGAACCARRPEADSTRAITSWWPCGPRAQQAAPLQPTCAAPCPRRSPDAALGWISTPMLRIEFCASDDRAGAVATWLAGSNKTARTAIVAATGSVDARESRCAELTERTARIPICHCVHAARPTVVQTLVAGTAMVEAVTADPLQDMAVAVVAARPAETIRAGPLPPRSAGAVRGGVTKVVAALGEKIRKSGTFGVGAARAAEIDVTRFHPWRTDTAAVLAKMGTPAGRVTNVRNTLAALARFPARAGCAESAAAVSITAALAAAVARANRRLLFLLPLFLLGGHLLRVPTHENGKGTRGERAGDVTPRPAALGEIAGNGVEAKIVQATHGAADPRCRRGSSGRTVRQTCAVPHPISAATGPH